MAQIRGTANYNLGQHGHQQFGNQGMGMGMGMGMRQEVNDPSPLEVIRKQTSKIEDVLDTMSEPVKP